MQSNKLRMAIRATAAVAVLGVAGQANAISFESNGYQMEVYGFARLAATYDIDEDIASGGQAGNFSSISTGSGDTADGHFGMDANTSRLGFSVVTPENVKIVIEADFDGSDGLDPRLRHAYGEYNNVLIGRNWSNYNSFVGSTSTLDFDSLPGTAGMQSRTEQIRYTTGALSFALEQPTNSVAGTTVGRIVDGEFVAATKDSSPLISARLEDSQGGFSYSAAVMAKQVSIDDGTTDDSAMGYAAFLAGRIALSDMITIQGAVNYGDGASSYVYRAGGNFSSVDAYEVGGDIETIEAYGASLGMGVDLGGGRSINLGYGYAQVDLDDAVADGAVAATTREKNSMLTLNYQWTPVEKVKMGVEYARLETEENSGEDGDANRLMFLAQYSF